MADGYFHHAIAKLGLGHLDKPTALDDRGVIRVLADALIDAADALQRVHEDKRRGALLHPGEIGAYIGVEVPGGVDIAGWLCDMVKAGQAAKAMRLRYEPLEGLSLKASQGAELQQHVGPRLQAILVSVRDLGELRRAGVARDVTVK